MLAVWFSMYVVQRQSTQASRVDINWSELIFAPRLFAHVVLPLIVFFINCNQSFALGNSIVMFNKGGARTETAGALWVIRAV